MRCRCLAGPTPSTACDTPFPPAVPAPSQVPFNLDSVVSHVEHILKTRGHAVVCMAEGAAKVRCGPGRLGLPISLGSYCGVGCMCALFWAASVEAACL